ncbi:hypothetical protein QCA50_003036 [Cerrena zonata]|uniref:Metallo-beta-lactamase domain-containing protein n=1 Tax=Cerrena zonata TaxID=2478898 RepID=A0AAW0GT43_9APHY
MAEPMDPTLTCPPLPPPSPNQPYVEVSTLLGGLFRLPMEIFVADSNPEDIVPNSPAFGFFLRHSVTKDQIIFDLGIRKDLESYPPATQRRIDKLFSPTRVPQSVDEILSKGGVKPEDVKTVMFSHLHWDHVGDIKPFTNATFVLGGQSEPILKQGYPHNLESVIDARSVPLDRTRFLECDLFTESIGPFPYAYDYYGDGSLYVVDAPGHILGHINLLVRTNSTGSWIYLAGDTCHDLRVILGEREFAVTHEADGTVICAHANPAMAKRHIARVQELYSNRSVEVILAHDWRWYEAAKGIRNVFFPGIITPRESDV